MRNIEGIMNMEGSQRFRDLVGQLVEDSRLLPAVQISDTEELSILDAIEKDEVGLYMNKNVVSGEMMAAIDCLLEIYTELEKDEPDEKLVASRVDDLEYQLTRFVV